MSGWLGLWPRKRPSPESAKKAAFPAPQKSLAFNVLCHQFREGRKHTILDLGAPIGRNIDFFSRFPCKIYVEDLYGTLTSFDYLSPEDGFSLDAVFTYLLPFQKGCRFDFILAWDVLNYLERDVFRQLMLHIEKFSRAGTFLFALLSTNRHIPESPHRFHIFDEETLLYELTSSVLRSCPQYEGPELDRLMHRFRTYNSFHLRNGYREYLFLFE